MQAQRPPSPRRDSSTEQARNASAPPILPLRRQATLYDAVAGRVGTNGFLTSAQRQSANIVPSAPEQVLLRRSELPQQFIYDEYDLAGRMPRDVRLPESDLLKAVHKYASDFYGAMGGAGDWRSMDETALLGVGILLEECVREVLGESGDLAFTEEEDLEGGLREDKMVRYQVTGRVRVASVKGKGRADKREEGESPAKKVRR